MPCAYAPWAHGPMALSTIPLHFMSTVLFDQTSRSLSSHFVYVMRVLFVNICTYCWHHCYTKLNCSLWNAQTGMCNTNYDMHSIVTLLNSIICDIRHEARICSIIILTLFYNNTAAYSG